MTQIIYVDRTRVQVKQRCARMRWLGYHVGENGMGLEPARRSSHLVVGGAVHAGMEVLLRSAQEWLDLNPRLMVLEAGTGQAHEATLEEQLEFMFVRSAGQADGKTVARQIEDRAVEAALAEFAEAWAEGVELDPEEARQRAAAAGGVAGQPEVVNDLMDLNGQLRASLAQVGAIGAAGGESPIIVEFGDLAGGGFDATTSMQPAGDPLATQQQAYQPAPAFDADQWLKEEMAALVEGMVRTWARRRWRQLLTDFEVLEVEREGEWILAQFDMTGECTYDAAGRPVQEYAKELRFLSRHDALLLERSTGYLYLQSFKTTGAWDRRKELDAQVDMQGLSEAVDVERRFAEAWELIHKEILVAETFGPSAPLADNAEYLDASRRVRELVSDRVAHWLRSLPDPPTILGVRYEYLLKGSRKENKKAQPGEPRWNQESILVRAYSQEGITSADRRWAWTYDWKDETGKGRRLDYRSWQKQPVWRSMPVAAWIDLLDSGQVQEGAMDDDGNLLDALAAQLVPVLVAYRNSDEMLDLLEQMEAQEREVAIAVEAVRQAEREGGYSAKRSALNRLFPQTRTACSYPGVCQFRSMPTRPGFCFGPPDAERDPGVMEHFRARVPNHPKEDLVQIASGGKQRPSRSGSTKREHMQTTCARLCRSGIRRGWQPGGSARTNTRSQRLGLRWLVASSERN